jgi:hypothetical protein
MVDTSVTFLDKVGKNKVVHVSKNHFNFILSDHSSGRYTSKRNKRTVDLKEKEVPVQLMSY